MSAVLTQVQDNELGAGLGVADLVLSHTLIKTLIRLHQSQHLQIMLILGETQKNIQHHLYKRTSVKQEAGVLGEIRMSK